MGEAVGDALKKRYDISPPSSSMFASTAAAPAQ